MESMSRASMNRMGNRCRTHCRCHNRMRLLPEDKTLQLHRSLTDAAPRIRESVSRYDRRANATPLLKEGGIRWISNVCQLIPNILNRLRQQPNMIGRKSLGFIPGPTSEADYYSCSFWAL